jgi:hypothetical protein
MTRSGSRLLCMRSKASIPACLECVVVENTSFSMAVVVCCRLKSIYSRLAGIYCG